MLTTLNLKFFIILHACTVLYMFCSLEMTPSLPPLPLQTPLGSSLPPPWSLTLSCGWRMWVVFTGVWLVYVSSSQISKHRILSTYLSYPPHPIQAKKENKHARFKWYLEWGGGMLGAIHRGAIHRGAIHRGAIHRGAIHRWASFSKIMSAIAHIRYSAFWSDIGENSLGVNVPCSAIGI